MAGIQGRIKKFLRIRVNNYLIVYDIFIYLLMLFIDVI